MKKLKVEELTRLAFLWAQQDRESLAEAWGKDTPEGVAAWGEANQLRNYRMKRCGRTKLEALLSDTKSMDVLKVKEHA